jgi:hypothetical protein
MAIILDYANGRPPGGAKQLKAAGVAGCIRYIKPAKFQWPKALTPLEVIDITWNGLGLAFNYENNALDYRGSYAAGKANGFEAYVAMNELSQGDPHIPVYVSIDTEVQVDDFDTARQYVEGFKSSCRHRIGVYGESALIAFLQQRGDCEFGWLSESTSFPSDPSAKLHLKQTYGKSVPGLPNFGYDYNDSLAVDWGQIPLISPPPPPPPPPNPDPPFKVRPQFEPPRVLDFVSELRLDAPHANPGSWGLQPDWGVITLAGSFHGTMFGQDAVKGRRPALIVPAGLVVPGALPPLKSYPAWAVYECIATSGERYLPQPPK